LALLYVTALLFGLVIGSFMNVCIFRIPEKRSIVNPPSACMSCGNRLKPYHNIPVLSYAFLGGRCAFCGTRISVQYPLVELANGLMYMLALYVFGPYYSAVGAMAMGSVFIVGMMISFERSSIPASVALFGLIVGAGIAIAAMGRSPSEAAIGAAAGIVGGYAASLATSQSGPAAVALLAGAGGALAGLYGAAAVLVLGTVLWGLSVLIRIPARRMLGGFVSLAAIAVLYGRLGEWVAGL